MYYYDIAQYRQTDIYFFPHFWDYCILHVHITQAAEIRYKGNIQFIFPVVGVGIRINTLIQVAKQTSRILYFKYRIINMKITAKYFYEVSLEWPLTTRYACVGLRLVNVISRPSSNSLPDNMPNLLIRGK